MFSLPLSRSLFLWAERRKGERGMHIEKSVPVQLNSHWKLSFSPFNLSLFAYFDVPNYKPLRRRVFHLVEAHPTAVDLFVWAQCVCRFGQHNIGSECSSQTHRNDENKKWRGTKRSLFNDMPWLLFTWVMPICYVHLSMHSWIDYHLHIGFLRSALLIYC